MPQERISECIVEQIVGPSRVQQSRQTPLEKTPPTRDKPAYKLQFDLAESVADTIVSSQTGTERRLAETQTTNEQQINTLQEFAHQQSEASSEASRISREDPSARVKDLITDFINMLQAQVSSEANLIVMRS